MKLILRQDFDKLGSKSDIVEVKAGYARNFLIPKKIAMELTKGNLSILETEREHGEMQGRREQRIALGQKEKLQKVSVTASITVGEDDRIFGTVTTQNVADLLKDKGFEIDRKNIYLEEQIKALGIYTVKIKLHSEVEAEIKLWVVKG